jgi:phosphate transport system substrate-binding protein
MSNSRVLSRRLILKSVGVASAAAAFTAIDAPRTLATTQPTTNSAALSRAREIGNKPRAGKKFYKPQFDLGGLPRYEPQARISGTIRQWGNNYLEDSGLIKVWEDAFRSFHPDVRFVDNLSSSSVAFPGLIAGAADLAPLGRQALWDELKGVEREGGASASEGVGDSELVEFVMATGSFNVRGWTFALGVFVHKDNPIERLTFDQLDGIFGAERTGGWKGLTWDSSIARGPEKNIRKWGQLGLAGAWAERPINVYGYNLKYHFADEFDKKILKGSSKWVETMRMYSNEAGLKADGSLSPGGELFMDDLSRDPFGIAYTGIPFLTPQTKPVTLSRNPGDPFVPLTLETVQDRTYPLLRDVFYYLRRRKGAPVDPRLSEFLRFVVSREGQQAIQEDGKYLPLTPDAAQLQLAKLA